MIPGGFEKQSAISQDRVPSVIVAIPLNQIALTTYEAGHSTNNEDSCDHSQSESAPQIRLNLDPSVTKVSSTSATEPLHTEPQFPTLRWTRSHPIDQILGNPHSGIKTRHQSGNICIFVNFVSLAEPKTIDDALPDPN